jgi:hypothetical protein
MGWPAPRISAPMEKSLQPGRQSWGLFDNHGKGGPNAGEARATVPGRSRCRAPGGPSSPPDRVPVDMSTRAANPPAHAAAGAYPPLLDPELLQPVEEDVPRDPEVLGRLGLVAAVLRQGARDDLSLDIN